MINKVWQNQQYLVLAKSRLSHDEFNKHQDYLLATADALEKSETMECSYKNGNEIEYERLKYHIKDNQGTWCPGSKSPFDGMFLKFDQPMPIIWHLTHCEPKNSRTLYERGPIIKKTTFRTICSQLKKFSWPILFEYWVEGEFYTINCKKLANSIIETGHGWYRLNSGILVRAC